MTQQFSLSIFTIETKITDSHSRVFGPFWVNKGFSFFKNTRKNFKSNLVLVHVAASGPTGDYRVCCVLKFLSLIIFFFIYFFTFPIFEKSMQHEKLKKKKKSLSCLCISNKSIAEPIKITCVQESKNSWRSWKHVIDKNRWRNFWTAMSMRK